MGGCYTCGSRIEYVAGQPGESLDSACTTVSDQFASGPCGPACNPAICNDNVLDEPDPAKLVWSDEFDVDGSPDPNKWDYDIGDGCPDICGWGKCCMITVLICVRCWFVCIQLTLLDDFYYLYVRE